MPKSKHQYEVTDATGVVVATFETEADAVLAASRLPEGHTARKAAP